MIDLVLEDEVKGPNLLIIVPKEGLGICSYVISSLLKH